MNTTIAIIAIAAAVLVGAAGLFYGLSMSKTTSQISTNILVPSENTQNKTTSVPIQTTSDLKKFNSLDDMRKYLLQIETQNSIVDVYPMGFGSGGFVRRDLEATNGASLPPIAVEPDKAAPTHDGTVSLDRTPYSTTNIQVENVDEPDFLKNDDRYAYIVSGDKLTIIDAYPAENSKILLKIGLDVQGQSLQNMFLNNDRLVIFYQGSGEQYSIQQYDYRPIPIYMPTTHAMILDVSDKENPKKVKDYEIQGNYYNARMIGNYVYFIVNNGVDFRNPMPPILKESSKAMIVPDVYYFDNPEQSYNFNTVSSFDIFGDSINSQTFMMGYTNTIYASVNNIYITYQKNMPWGYYENNNVDRFYKIIVPLLPEDVQNQIKSLENSNLGINEKWNKISDLLQDTYNKMDENSKNQLFEKIQKSLEEYDTKVQQEGQKTIVHKISIENGNLKYVSKGEVPGYLLNQFSMDESGNRFRMATTSNYWTPQHNYMYNNVYVLDENLNIVGSAEKIAPDESIYSTRFIGDKLYMVTFQRIDPFFVIDLSSDTPKILGQLKIPGYSSYLHPFDENHIIGIGKETKENKWGGVETLGVKASLFDVSDFNNPKEVGSIAIAGAGTDTEILWDHKAFFFDKEKNVLSLPIQKQDYGQPMPLDTVDKIAPGDDRIYQPPKTWRGFYILAVDLDNGFTMKGQIEHSVDNIYYYGYGSRTFYIGDVLYTVSPGLMKMNDINDIKHEINSIELENTGKIIPYLK